MTAFVKRFIENNIDLVEKEQWEDLIIEWTAECMLTDINPNWFYELCDVMSSIGYELLSETEEARKRYIYNLACEKIKNELYEAKIDGKDYIYKDAIVLSIEETVCLGFGRREIEKIVDTAATQDFSMSISGGLYLF